MIFRSWDFVEVTVSWHFPQPEVIIGSRKSRLLTGIISFLEGIWDASFDVYLNYFFHSQPLTEEFMMISWLCSKRNRAIVDEVNNSVTFAHQGKQTEIRAWSLTIFQFKSAANNIWNILNYEQILSITKVMQIFLFNF